MTDLVARAVLNGDASGLVGASAAGETALNKVGAAAKNAGASGKEAAGGFDAAAKALQGQATAAELAAAAIGASTKNNIAEIAALQEMAAQGAETASAIGSLDAAHGAYSVTVSRARELLAANIITQADYDKAVDAATVSLAAAIAVQNENVKSLLGERDAAVLAAAAIGDLGKARVAAFGTGLSDAVGAQARSEAQLTAETAALRAQIDPLGAAALRMNAAIAKSTQLFEAGRITQAEHAAATALARKTYQDFEAGLKSAGGTVRGLEEDVAHLTERMGVGRGSVLSFRAALDLIAEHPVAAAVIAMTAAIIGLAYEENVLENANIGILNSITLTGNALGLTGGQVETLTADIAKLADVSQVSAEAVAASFIKNRIDPSLWTLAADAVRGYAVATGKDVPAAAEDMAEKLNAGAQGVKDLEAVLGKLDKTTEDNVVGLINSGHATDAARLALTKWKPELDDMANHVSTFDRFIQSAEKHISDWAAAAEHAAEVGQNIEFGDGSALAGDSSKTLPGAGVTDDPLVAHMLQRKAAIDGLVNDASALSKALDPYPAQLDELAKEQDKYTEALKRTGLTSDQQKTLSAALNDIGVKRQQVLKAQRDAQLNLNDAEKAHEELVKRLILTEGPQAVSAAEADASALEKQAAAYGQGAFAVKALVDQYAIEKATLPYLTALHYAHGAAVQKLHDIIDGLTDAIDRQQKAQNELAAVQDVHQQFTGLSDLQTFDPLKDQFRSAQEIQKLSSDIAKDQINDNQEWLDFTSSQLDAWYAKNKSTLANAAGLYQQYTSEMQTIFGVKQAKIYADDLARRTDWLAGSERGYEALEKATDNWAKTSEQLTADASAETENDILGMVTGGKDALQDFETFWEKEFLKLLYQRYLANDVNSFLGQGINLIGDALGVGDAGSAGVDLGSDIASSAIGAETHHTGLDSGMAGQGNAMRYTHPDYFDDAPRFHKGRRGTDLAPNEVPAILTDDEWVLTPPQMRAILNDRVSAPVQVAAAAPAAPQVNFNVKTAPGISVTQGQRTANANGGFDQEVIVDYVDNRLAERSGQGRSKFTKSLENTHNIRRSPL